MRPYSVKNVSGKDYSVYASEADARSNRGRARQRGKRPVYRHVHRYTETVIRHKITGDEQSIYSDYGWRIADALRHPERLHPDVTAHLAKHISRYEIVVRHHRDPGYYDFFHFTRREKLKKPESQSTKIAKRGQKKALRVQAKLEIKATVDQLHHEAHCVKTYTKSFFWQHKNAMRRQGAAFDQWTESLTDHERLDFEQEHEYYNDLRLSEIEAQDAAYDEYLYYVASGWDEVDDYDYWDEDPNYDYIIHHDRDHHTGVRRLRRDLNIEPTDKAWIGLYMDGVVDAPDGPYYERTDEAYWRFVSRDDIDTDWEDEYDEYDELCTLMRMTPELPGKHGDVKVHADEERNEERLKAGERYYREHKRTVVKAPSARRAA